MKGKTTYHLTGSTLVEVLVSLSMIGLVFTLGMLLFQRLTSLNSPPEVFKSRALVRQVLAEPIDPEVLESEREIMGRRLVKKLLVLQLEPALYEVQVQCFWDERLLEERNRYVWGNQQMDQ